MSYTLVSRGIGTNYSIPITPLAFSGGQGSKEGRQPTTWEETLHLLPLHRTNRLRCLLGQGGREG